MTYQNPIIRGYQPDPSVCRVGNKFYLVTSSFQYFPGVPLFESDDLINWKQIGYCLTRESQLPLKGSYSSGGIFAPTIRHYNNRFYMTTTNVTGMGNFYVYTDDIYGEWSEPICVNQEGIDPSLYFEDGKAYFMSNADGAITQSEINIETGELLSEPIALWRGTGGRYLESPHLYKIGGYYYLMAAEGGTEYGHMVTYARSKNINGIYEPYPNNPVLTNRNLGGYMLQGIGHADLIDDENGNWWILHLGFRQIDRWLTFHHLGREVFMMPVCFTDDGWFNINGGITAIEVETELINTVQKLNNSYTPIERRFLRKFEEANYIFDENIIKIKSSSDTLDDAGSPAFVGFNQKEFDIELSVKVKVLDGEAGVVFYMDEEHYYALSIQNNQAKLTLKIGDIKHEKASCPVTGNEAVLKIKADAINYEFFCDNKLLGTARTRYLSSEVAGGFTGVVIGLFSQNGVNGGFNEFSELQLPISR